jgi:DNA polymerase-3 subunit epsilon
MVLDTLTLAREIHPGQRNSLDALCKRYEVDASKRDVHGALIDSELLARVYLAMTGGQSSLLLDEEVGAAIGRDPESQPMAAPTRDLAAPVNLKVIKATEAEAAAHEAMLEKIRQSGACVWDFD